MEESIIKIKNFESFLEKHLENGTKVQSYVTRYLTKFGDNYGSTMLAVTATVQKETGPPYNLEVVAKTPPSNPILRALFQFEKTSVKENAIYTEMFPVIVDLQRELNTPDCDSYDILPRCYGARLSLQKDAIFADDDAVLVLENLKEKGYVNGNRLESFNMEESKAMLRHLAKFHALPIAVRHHKPHLFEKHFKPYLNFLKLGLDEESDRNMLTSVFNSITRLTEFNDYIDMIKEAFAKHNERLDAHYVRQENIDFCTAVHNDFWVNNMMIKYEDGIPKHVKIVDFQITIYGSLAYDVIFFLFTSVKVPLLENNFDDLLLYYYDQFTSVLKNANVPLDNYSYEKFLIEINAVARLELVHLMILLRPIFTRTHDIADKKDDKDVFNQDDALGDEYFKQLRCCLNQYVKRDWIL